MYTGVAGAGQIRSPLELLFLDVGGESTWNIFDILNLDMMLLGRYSLSSTVNNLAIFNKSLD